MAAVATPSLASITTASSIVGGISMSGAAENKSAATDDININTNHNNNGSVIEVFGGSRKGAKQWNEDSFCSFVSSSGKCTVGAVFDGHGGYNGLVASSTAREVSLEILNKNREEMERWSVEEWYRQLHSLFDTIHRNIRDRFLHEKPAAIPSSPSSASTTSTSPTSSTATAPSSVSSLSGVGASPAKSATSRRYVDEKGIVRAANGDPIHGGTTGSMVVSIRRDSDADGSPEFPYTIITANVGDSTALLCPQPTKGKYEFLTVDHGPESQEEFLRVRALPRDTHPEKLLFVYDKTNVFRKYECPSVFTDDGAKDQTFVANPWGNGLHPTNVRYEPAVYAVTPRSVAKDSTCIAMTRALGDFYAHQFGLTWVPSITTRRIAAGIDYSILLASDGIWDCWKYEDFMQYFNDQYYTKRLSLEASGTASLNESITRAIANFGSKHFDDAALVTWVLKAPKTASTTASPSGTPTAIHGSVTIAKQ